MANFFEELGDLASDIGSFTWNVITLDFEDAKEDLRAIGGRVQDWVVDLLGLDFDQNLTEGILVQKSGTTQAIPIVYGKRKVGINIVHIHTSGTDNSYLWMVGAICEGEIESIDNIYVDDLLYTDPKYSGHISVWEHLGSATQTVDVNLSSADPNWTVNHRLRGVAYIVIRFTWNQEPFCKTRMPIHRICFYSGISGNPPVFSPFRYELPPRHSRKPSMPWRLLCVDYCSPFARLPTGRNKCLIFPCVPFLPFP